MGVHVTKYETKNGKTRKVKNALPEGSAQKDGAAEPASGAGNKTAGNSGGKGA